MGKSKLSKLALLKKYLMKLWKCTSKFWISRSYRVFTFGHVALVLELARFKIFHDLRFKIHFRISRFNQNFWLDSLKESIQKLNLGSNILKLQKEIQKRNLDKKIDDLKRDSQIESIKQIWFGDSRFFKKCDFEPQFWFMNLESA